MRSPLYFAVCGAGIVGCAVTAPIQLAASSKSGFDGAVYKGTNVNVREATPGREDPSLATYASRAVPRCREGLLPDLQQASVAVGVPSHEVCFEIHQAKRESGIGPLQVCLGTPQCMQKDFDATVFSRLT